jgi:hypothetical protein
MPMLKRGIEVVERFSGYAHGSPKLDNAGVSTPRPDIVVPDAGGSRVRRLSVERGVSACGSVCLHWRQLHAGFQGYLQHRLLFDHHAIGRPLTWITQARHHQGNGRRIWTIRPR